jgi:hypothetical protein
MFTIEGFLVDLNYINIDQISEILFVYVTGQMEVGLIWHDQNIKTPSSFSTISENCVQKFTREALSCSFISRLT